MDISCPDIPGVIRALDESTLLNRIVDRFLVVRAIFFIAIWELLKYGYRRWLRR
jgi:hypothetical protein